MPVPHVSYRIQGFARIAALGHLSAMPPADARQRCLRVTDTHGLEATEDAFHVSQRTLYRWSKTLRECGRNPAAFAARSSAPKHRCTPKTDRRIVSEIRRLRSRHAQPWQRTFCWLIERVHRTVQKPFVDAHEALHWTDLEAFNQQLADWLFLDNAKVPTTLSARDPHRSSSLQYRHKWQR